MARRFTDEQVATAEAQIAADWAVCPHRRWYEEGQTAWNDDILVAAKYAKGAVGDQLWKEAWFSLRRRRSDACKVHMMTCLAQGDLDEFARITETDHLARRKQGARKSIGGPSGRQEFRAEMDARKAAVGCPCGERDPACLDFHHRDPFEKVFNISMGTSRPWNTVLAEIKKCSIICSNCHRKLTRRACDEKMESGNHPGCAPSA